MKKSLLTKVAMPIALAVAVGVSGCSGDNKDVYIPRPYKFPDKQTSTSINLNSLEKEIRQYVTFQPQNNIDTFSRFAEFSGLNEDSSNKFGNKSVWINVVENPENYGKVVDGEHFVNVYLGKEEGSDLLIKLRNSYDAYLSDNGGFP